MLTCCAYVDTNLLSIFEHINNVTIKIKQSTAPVNLHSFVSITDMSECLSDCANQVKPIFRNITAMANSAMVQCYCKSNRISCGCIQRGHCSTVGRPHCCDRAEETQRLG